MGCVCVNVTLILAKQLLKSKYESGGAFAKAFIIAFCISCKKILLLDSLAINSD